MNRRAMTLVPIVLGGAAGALLGVFDASPKNTSAEVSASTVRGAVASVTTAQGEAPPSASPLPSSAPPPVESANAVGSEAPHAAAQAPRKRAFDLSEPSTQEALLAAQVQCNRSSPEECERAAFALESGSLGTKDAPRARSLRRIALTLYVKQCEGGRALACARLAEMYDAGDIVQANPRNAEALRKRVSELCAQRPGEPGCSS